ncbi:MAG: alpha/beta hydrolase [Alphaproteobacteria bacterium]
MPVNGAFWYRSILWVIFCYIFLVLLLYVCQRRLIYQSSHKAPPATVIGEPANKQIIYVETQDGLRLQSWFWPPAEQGKKVIVYFHGNAGAIDIRVEPTAALVKAGYGLLLLEYRGYGGNSGQPSETGLYHDARAAINWLQKTGIPLEKMILLGESLGSGVAVQLATEYKQVAGVILEAPYTSIPDVGQERLPFIPVKLLTTERFDSLRKIPNLQAPLLVLHGTADYLIPFHHGEAIFKAAPPNPHNHFVRLQNIGHVDLIFDHAAFHILPWLEQLDKEKGG